MDNKMDKFLSVLYNSKYKIRTLIQDPNIGNVVELDSFGTAHPKCIGWFGNGYPHRNAEEVIDSWEKVMIQNRTKKKHKKRKMKKNYNIKNHGIKEI